MSAHAPTAPFYYGLDETKIVRGRGVYVFDDNGNAYLDCGAGTFNLSLGYSHPGIVDILKMQSEELIHVTSSFPTDPLLSLATNLLHFAPPNITKVNPKVSSGSVANEGAVKMAQCATGKHEVISLFRSHHGQTMMTASMSGNAFRKEPFPMPYPGMLHVPDPYCYRCFYDKRPETCGMYCVSQIQEFLEYASSGNVAALIVEPISGNGGNIVPPRDYLPALRAFCSKHGIRLIFDEIQTGIGRTGHMFAAEYFGVEPDAITIAKGLGGSGAQAAAILTADNMHGMDPVHHSFTYGSNVLAAAVAAKTLEIVGQPEFLLSVRRTGAYIIERLRELALRFPEVDDVRGVGLMIGMELIQPDGSPAVKLTNHLASVAKRYGLLIRTSRYGRGNVLKIRPPLIITMEEATELCDKVEQLFKGEISR